MDVADVGTPFLVGTLASKVLIKQIGGDWPAMAAISGLLVAAFLQCLQSIVTHQPGHTMASDIETTFLKLEMHARCA